MKGSVEIRTVRVKHLKTTPSTVLWEPIAWRCFVRTAMNTEKERTTGKNGIHRMGEGGRLVGGESLGRFKGKQRTTAGMDKGRASTAERV
jgi:hypothetical protein